MMMIITTIIIIHFSDKNLNMSVVNRDKTIVIVVETSLSDNALKNDVVGRRRFCHLVQRFHCS